jgi:hypothetical protein
MKQNFSLRIRTDQAELCVTSSYSVAFRLQSFIPCFNFLKVRDRPQFTSGMILLIPLGTCLLRKEVIQPQVPLRLPCYDFVPITGQTLGRCLLAVNVRTSGSTGFHDVTGGVYKARERIHGAVADAPLLAIPASWRRVAASNPNWAQFYRISSTSRSCFPLYWAL